MINQYSKIWEWNPCVHVSPACFTASATTATYSCANPAPGVPAFSVRPVTVEPMPSQDMLLWPVIKLEDMAIEIFDSYKSGLVLPML